MKTIKQFYHIETGEIMRSNRASLKGCVQIPKHLESEPEEALKIVDKQETEARHARSKETGELLYENGEQLFYEEDVIDNDTGETLHSKGDPILDEDGKPTYEQVPVMEEYVVRTWKEVDVDQALADQIKDQRRQARQDREAQEATRKARIEEAKARIKNGSIDKASSIPEMREVLKDIVDILGIE